MPQSLAGALQRIALFFAIVPGGYTLQLFQKCRPLAFRVWVCLTCAGQFHKILFLSILLRYFFGFGRGAYICFIASRVVAMKKRGSTEAFPLFAGLFKLCNGFFIRNKFFHIVKV